MTDSVQPLTSKEASVLLNKWRSKPHTYIDEVLGVEKIWKLQDQLLAVLPQAIKEHKQIFIGSGHALGKDYICAAICLWFLHCFSPSIVIQTAPTDRQVRKIMWGETLGHWNNKKIDLGGTAFTSPYLEIMQENWYLIGFTTKETGASKKAEGGKFQGFHSPNVLVVVSEAQAVEDSIYDQIEAITTSAVALVIFIGNPTRASGGFAKGLRNKIDNIVFNFDCRENPNYKQRKVVVPGLASYEWVEAKRKKWGEEDPRWYGRVLGQIPKTSINNVFSEKDIELMQKKQGLGRYGHNAGVAIDSAGEGDDENVIYGGRNGEKLTEFTQTNIAPSVAAIKCVQMVKEIKGNFIIIDCDGLGIGVYQELMKLPQELTAGIHIVKYHGCSSIKSEEPDQTEKPEFQNIRARAWFNGRERAQKGQACLNPEDKELKEDLLEIKFWENTRGLIQIEDKADIKERLGRSPSKGDAWNMLQWGFSQNYPKIDQEDTVVDRQGQGQLEVVGVQEVNRPYHQ